MKYNITDLMDLYEDRDCPLTPLNPSAQKNETIHETGKEYYEVKQTKHSFGWKQGLSVAAAVVLLVAGGFGIKTLLDRNNGSIHATIGESSNPIYSESNPVTETPEYIVPAESEKEVTSSRPVLGLISIERERLNRFLTGFVQQDIENSKTDLDEDAELVRFVFRYLKYNQPSAVLEQEDGGVSCLTLTLEQVNETLSRLLGKTITPDREDYSIPGEESEEFNCFFHDGCFWHTPPYYSYTYGYPLTFALVDSIDEENNTLHFRLYKVNPLVWEDGEAERHIPVLPAMSFLDAEGKANGDIIRIGEGEAILQSLEGDLQLVELSTSYTQQ